MPLPFLAICNDLGLATFQEALDGIAVQLSAQVSYRLISASTRMPCHPARRRSQYWSRMLFVKIPGAPLPSAWSLTRVTGTMPPAVVERKAS